MNPNYPNLHQNFIHPQNFTPHTIISHSKVLSPLHYPLTMVPLTIQSLMNHFI